MFRRQVLGQPVRTDSAVQLFAASAASRVMTRLSRRGFAMVQTILSGAVCGIGAVGLHFDGMRARRGMLLASVRHELLFRSHRALQAKAVLPERL
ncbi:hypothetical protein CK215_17150 [Mesorhizobium sp. WSM3864]|nr:hypothetical protein CK215_17150 [Mesorhizobium sp. WSM3864]